MCLKKIIAILILFFHGSSFLFPQAQFVNSVYSQDFGTANIATWTNNSTFLGWYLDNNNFQGTINITAAAPSNNGGQYMYTCSGGTDMKLGTRPSNGSESGSGPCANLATSTCGHGIGLRLVNTFGNTIVALTVQYDWYQFSLAENGGNANGMFFSYKQGATVTSVTGTGWTNVASLDFLAPQSSAVGGGNQLNGYPCTQTGTKVDCFLVTVPHGEEVMLRWWDPNNSNNDPHLGIDNVIVTAYADNICNVVLFNNDYKFKAIKNNSSYHFNWKNLPQQNIMKYFIEHSSDGKIFRPIDSLFFSPDSNEELYIDRLVEKKFDEKVSLFRLKAVNEFQEISYSKMVVVNNYSINETVKDAFYFYKYAQMENGAVYFKLNTPRQINVSILDLSGMSVFSQTNNLLKEGEYQMTIPKLNKGVYILAVSGLADKTQYKKIIISE